MLIRNSLVFGERRPKYNQDIGQKFKNYGISRRSLSPILLQMVRDGS